MRCLFRIIFVIGLLFPFFAEASCFEKGYTVVFANGILNSKIEALENSKELQDKLPAIFNNEPIVVKLAYNQSHLAGIGDLVEANFPVFDDYDLNTILMQMHADVTTRKVLLVGHSQGSVYANKIYEYLVAHGVPAQDVAVYAVATPASYVAGGGKYITYTLDDIISLFVKKYTWLHPLPANVTFSDLLNSPDLTTDTVVQGHSFIDIYLGGFGTRTVGDMQGAMAQLDSAEGTAKDGCFDTPGKTLAYRAQRATLAVADPVVGTAGAGLRLAGKGIAVATNATKAAVSAVGRGLSSAGSAVGSFFSSLVPKPRTQNLPGSFGIVKAIYGSSVSEADLQELLGTNQGGAVVLAAPQPPPPAPAPASKQTGKGEVRGAETQKPEPFIPPPPAIGGGYTPGFGGGGSASPPPSAPPAPAPAQPMTITYTFTAYDENGVSTVCSFDDAPPVPCEGTYSQLLDPGPHTFAVTATDPAGNQSTQTRHFTIR